MITKADVELRMGALRLIDCTDDDHDGVADTAIVQGILDDATAVMEVALQTAGHAIPVEVVTPFMRLQGAWIGAHLAARRRAEWHDEKGNAPYHVEHDAALVELGKLASRKASPEGQPPPAIAVASRPRRGW